MDIVRRRDVWTVCIALTVMFIASIEANTWTGPIISVCVLVALGNLAMAALVIRLFDGDAPQLVTYFGGLGRASSGNTLTPALLWLVITLVIAVACTTVVHSAITSTAATASSEMTDDESEEDEDEVG